MTEWIRLDGVQKTIEDFQLGPVDFSIEPGMITALAGTNGSGKTTLLKMIMGLSKPEAGRITVGGKDVAGEDESWKRHITYLPQTMTGWNPYTGHALKELIAPLYEKWDEELFQWMAELFDLPLGKRFNKLSQGMQQKLALALALPRGTELMILDEPMNFLDIPSRKHLTDLLVEWMEKDERAIILASHQIEDFKKLADYLYVMRDGQTNGYYEKSTLLESYRRYWLGSMPEDAVPGEIERGVMDVVTADPVAADRFFETNRIPVLESAALELEEIINILLK